MGQVQNALWAAADRCPHDNTNNKYTEPASKDENDLKWRKRVVMEPKNSTKV